MRPTLGWQWPVEVTPMPDVRSSIFLPSAVCTQLPSPLTATTSCARRQLGGGMDAATAAQGHARAQGNPRAPDRRRCGAPCASGGPRQQGIPRPKHEPTAVPTLNLYTAAGRCLETRCSTASLPCCSACAMVDDMPRQHSWMDAASMSRVRLLRCRDAQITRSAPGCQMRAGVSAKAGRAPESAAARNEFAAVQALQCGSACVPSR